MVLISWTNSKTSGASFTARSRPWMISGRMSAIVTGSMNDLLSRRGLRRRLLGQHYDRAERAFHSVDHQHHRLELLTVGYAQRLISFRQRSDQVQGQVLNLHGLHIPTQVFLLHD